MKGVLLVSTEPDLANLALEVLRGVGAGVAPDGMAQLQDERGRLFTMFIDTGDDEWRHEPVTPACDGPQPDLETASACWIECRWEEMFTALVRMIALALPTTSWVIDGDGVLWPAADVDPARVRL